jgi:hypothetical protein
VQLRHFESREEKAGRLGEHNREECLILVTEERRYESFILWLYRTPAPRCPPYDARKEQSRIR